LDSFWETNFTRRNSLKLFAEFTFEIETAELIYRVILPELNDYFSGRSEICLFFEDTKNLVLRIKAEDPVSLRSAINTWFRLIQIAQEILEATI
jgi:KEOPS complex subunit Pcc1